MLARSKYTVVWILTALLAGGCSSGASGSAGGGDAGGKPGAVADTAAADTTAPDTGGSADMADSSTPPDTGSGQPDGSAGGADATDTADDTADTAPPGVVPTPAIPVQMPAWTVVLPVKVNGLEPWPFLLDTGSSYFIVTPPLVAQIQGPTATVELGGHVFEDIAFTPYALDNASGLLGVELGGIVGYPLMKDLVMAIDSRTQTLYPLETWRDDYDFGDHVAWPFESVPFTLAKGNTLAVQGRFEEMDKDVGVLLDTGTSSAVISQTLFEALGADTDGRTVLLGSKTSGATGEVEAPIVRIRSFGIGTKEATKMWVSVAPDAFFDKVSNLTGQPIYAIVGGGFLREVLAVIDYPATTVRLASYTSLDHVTNEFRSVGVEVIREAGAFHIYTVFTGSDAESKGVAVGDELIELDGAGAASKSTEQVLAVLRGEPGTTVEMKLAHEGNPYSVVVAREDLLPDLE